MGRSLELLTGFVTAPSTTFTGLTMAVGNTLTIRNGPPTAMVRLLQAWADNQGAGNLRIRSPKLHDMAQGIRAHVSASDVAPLLSGGVPQRLYPQDLLVVELTGSATGGDIETASLLVYYDDVPGTEARLVKWSDIAGRIKHLAPVENTLALGTAGGYSGEETIIAEFDNWKANTDYALLGYLVSAECAAVRWRGSDTGNVGIGGPGNETLRHVTADWFKRLSLAFDLPLIPVFNSANKGAILIDGAQDENGTDVTVTSLFAELEGGAGTPVAR